VNLQATATAHAPGSVTSVQFSLQATGGNATATANGPTGDPSNFAAQLSTGGGTITDGPAHLFATVNYPGGTLATTAGVAITVDLTPPAIAMVSDGRASFLGPANATASVVATVTDGGAGVDPTTVKLTLLSATQKTYAGTAGTGNQFTFSVPMSDTGVADGATGSVAFKITASDKVLNAATLTGDARQVIQVDRVKPTVSITTSPTTWHASSEVVNVTGNASDSQSGLSGGAAAVTLSSSSAAGNLTATGTISGSTYTIPADLSTLSFASDFEGAVAISVSLTDAAGNTQTATSSLNVDRAPPTISGIALPNADLTVGTRAWFHAGGGNLTITANIVDNGIGVDPNSVTLQLANGSPGTLGLPISGNNTTGNTYSFSLPRSVGTGLDGSAPVQFTITANDRLSHSTTSAPQSIYFDDVGPLVTKVSDPRWYARTTPGGSVIITLHETVVDTGVGLSAASVTLTVNPPGTPQTAQGTCTAQGDCTFTLDASSMPAGTEGKLNFTITATDILGHSSTTGDSRNVDDKPPTVNITSVTNPRSTIGATGVAYPNPIANTGYDGTHFIYSDTLTISGTITDASGISVTASPPNYEVDGTASGPKIAITSCTDGQASCNFTATVTLNDPTQAGAFHASIAAMSLVVNSADKAVDGTGAPASHVGSSSPMTFNVTRFWWKSTPAGAVAVGGLAIQSDGTVVVTTNAAAGSDTVFALNHDGPLNANGATTWHKGANFYAAASDLGEIDGAPAIGSSGTVYLATKGGDFVALSSSGTTTWNCGASQLGAFHFTPAIVQFPLLGSHPNCEGPLAAADDGNTWGACQASPNCTPRPAVMSDIGTSAAISLGGKYYVGTNAQMAQLATTAQGNLLASTPFPTALGTWTSIITDGTQFYATNPSSTTSTLYEFNSPTSSTWSAPISKSINGQPVVQAGNAGLILNTSDKAMHSVSTTGTDTPFATLGAAGATPLLGSDGLIYTAVGTAMGAIASGASAPTWTLTPAGATAFNVAPTMSCDGTLYAAAGSTVYAFVTDARGLANTPWPKYQRDTRNSGNADATTQWGVRINPSTCTQ
jgi:hypothetical protein